MNDNVLQRLRSRLGFEWRIPMARRWVFYALTCSNFLELIRFERRGGPLDCVQVRGGGVLHFESAREALDIFNEIWFGRVYTRRFSGRAPRTVVDIGANIGAFTLLAKRLWPSCRVSAYEPDHRNYALLGRNLAESQVQQVAAFNQAVAAGSGRGLLYLKAQSGWHSLYKDADDQVFDRLEVDTVGLEQVIAASGGWVDFLKLDCEGCEWAMLSGKEALLGAGVGYVAMEYHEEEGHCHSELVELFGKAGFDTQAIPPDRWRTGRLYAGNRRAHRPG